MKCSVIASTIILVMTLSACSTTKPKTTEESMQLKTAKINAQLGLAYLEKHNLKRAKQKLLTAIDQGPYIPEPWYSMAYFYEATGNMAMAEQYYLKAIKVLPTRGDSHNNYGTFLCRAGRYAESIKHFDIAVNDSDYLSPADAYENAGVCALKAKNKKQAIYYFKRAIAQDSNRELSHIKLAELENNPNLKKFRHEIMTEPTTEDNYDFV